MVARSAHVGGQPTSYANRASRSILTEVDRQDTIALGDVLTTATDEELRFLNHGLALAGSSAAKVELVARKVEMFSNINNRRIARRFGR
jgi:hypothetical protein